MSLDKGAVYSYDPIGTIERIQYNCTGSAEPVIQPFLDNQIGKVNIFLKLYNPKHLLIF